MKDFVNIVRPKKLRRNSLFSKMSTFSNEREKLFSYIEKSCNNFSNLSEENKFIWLMTLEDIDIIVKLANHIFTCFNIRK